MIDSLINYDIASMDATTIQVLDEPDRAASTKSYMYCFRGGGEKDQVILYDYNDIDHQTFVANWFEGFSGTIHSDADSFFNKLYAQDNVHNALCHAHARRKFEAIANTSKKSVLAHHAMQVYRKLYMVEKKATSEKLNPDEIKQLRQTLAKPLLETFKAWLEDKIGLVPQQSPIFKAMRYTLKNWDGLTRYLDNGRLVSITTTLSEKLSPLSSPEKTLSLLNHKQALERWLCTLASFEQPSCMALILITIIYRSWSKCHIVKLLKIMKSYCRGILI